MTTYSEIISALDEIAESNVRNRQLVTGARDRMSRAQTNLAAMPGSYSGLSAEIDDLATNNPSDEAWQDVRRVKDKLVADFQNLKTYVDALLVAFDGVTE